MNNNIWYFSKRMIPFLIVLGIFASLLPSANKLAAANGTITAELRAQFVEVGGVAKVTVKDGNGTEITGASFQSMDTNVATVDSNGIITGVTIGKTSVTVTAQGETVSVDFPVVGENLLTRQSVENGIFDGGIYHPSETPPSTSTQYFWCNNYAATGQYSYQQHTLLANHESYINASTNILKYTFGPNTDNAPRRDIRLQTFTTAGLYAGIQGNLNGTIPVSTNKLYEYTGWIKAENTTTLATDVSGDLFYYNGTSYITNSYKRANPWTGKSGDQPWTFFTVNAIPLNTWNPSYALGADVRINSVMASKQGDILVADLSFHEVKYDKLDFTATVPENLNIDENITTAVKHFSNTGNEILNVSSETGQNVPIGVTYSSSNTAVATVSASGVITTVGNGSANITAMSTIAGVTLSDTITINVGMGIFTSAALSVSDASSGRVANKTKHSLKITAYDAFNNVISSDAANITYCVAAPSVAAVTPDGGLYAKTIGTTDITATVELNGITKTTVLSVNVCESGENMLADRNGDFESAITDSNWDWAVGYTAPNPSATVPQWTEVGAVERDGNVYNKALAIVLNPNVAPRTYSAVVLKTNENGRVKLKPGKFYEMTAWIKTDNLTSPDGVLFNLYVDLYDYNDYSSSATAFPVTIYRNLNYRNENGYPDSYASWKKITLPVAAPTDTTGELWVTPRIIVRHPNYSTVTQTGYGGKIWMDDIELREVGFDRIEATKTGPSAAYGDVSTITLTPYSTTNNFISILQAQIPNVSATASSDPDIISTAAAAAATYTPLSQITSMAKIPSIAATVKGKNGDATVDCSVTIGGEKRSTAVSYTLSNLADMFGTVTVTAGTDVMKPDAPGTQLTVAGAKYSGTPLDLSGAQIIYSSSNTSVVAVNSTGYAAPVGTGSTLITATVTLNGITRTGQIYISVGSGKTGSSYYTASKISAACTNIQTYTWAASLKDAAVTAAAPYVGKEDLLWSMVANEGLPRGITVGFMNDPDAYTCRYCGANLMASNGNYPWICNPMGEPWKIKCPVCQRRFPSNDFESFYKSGIDEHGLFNYQQALINGRPYLQNVLYPEKGEGWGVDDGFGYKPGRTYSNGVEECHTYIAYYMHWGLWRASGSNNPGILISALEKLRDAYLYTGDTKYGRTGAILVDRIADVYPDFDLLPYSDYYNSHGMSYRGKTVGCIWETSSAKSLALAYDAFYPAMNDSYVVNFLNSKAVKYGLVNTKATPALIRENCEDGILRFINDGCKTGKICGNFGMHQSAMATAAVVLDSMPETREWIDWVFNAGTGWTDNITGGNVMPQLVNDVDRDGQGNEAAPGYNYIWLSNTMLIADALAGYTGYAAADLYQNPKFRKMFSAMFPLAFSRRATAQIGDSGATASTGFAFNKNDLITGFQHFTDNKVAQMIYCLNGNTTSGLHADIFTANPESIAASIQNIINTQGTYNFDKSEQIPGYGFAILRDGTYVNASNDTQRDFWMYYGGGTSHKHPDALNVGIHAYGLDMAPDLGYPETAGPEPNRMQWINNTISHNTVVVNETKQASLTANGVPMHFDDVGQVKVMDVDDKAVYSSTSIYRRTLIMIKANEDVSYGVDFFRIKGGTDHMYSFHSQSDEIYQTQGINLVEQSTGTYAGPDVEWGANNSYLNGYSWLRGVRKASNPGTGTFSVDFKVKDFRNVLPSGRAAGLHLRMTMLNGFPLNEVSICKGSPPRTVANSMIPELDFVLARRSGTDLDTLFTTVFEPYDTTRYLSSMVSVPTTIVSGTETIADTVKAIKVTHTNGRVDYIVYATNNQVEYRIDNVFNFRGFIGVYTLENDICTYAYMNDGSLIGNTTGNAAVIGQVTDFTQTLSSSNSITVSKDFEVDPTTLAGKFIYITNDEAENAAYEIISAENSGDNLILNIGDVTPIRSYLDSSNINNGYIFNIAVGQSYRIPLSKESN